MNAATPESMRAYYAQRAAEYERVYAKPERQADLRAIEAWLPPWFAGRRVLEVACGTAWWTPHAAREARAWLATDVNEETLAIARGKALPPSVRLARLDAYALSELAELGGTQTFDAAFAGFWWSHVPRLRLRPWLDALHAQLAPGARVVFIDNRYVDGSSQPLERTDAEGNTYQWRRLDDGSRHEVLKNYPSREDALATIGPRVRAARWHAWPHYWALTYELA